MDKNDIIKILKDNELTEDEIIIRVIGNTDIYDKSREGYLKLGAQILMENKIEFILNSLLKSNIVGIKRRGDLMEKEYFYKYGFLF